MTGVQAPHAVPVPAPAGAAAAMPRRPEQGLAAELAAPWERLPPAGWVLGDVPRPAPTPADADDGYVLGWEQAPPAGWVLGEPPPPTHTDPMQSANPPQTFVA